MDLTAGFLIYATLFRLTIIGAGLVSIVLGYWLFLRAVAPTPGRGAKDKAGGETGIAAGTDAEAKGGGFTLSIRNAAPGTCFAVFGAAIISVMVVQGNPELAWQKLAAAGQGAERPDLIESVTLKGRDEANSGLDRRSFHVLMELGLNMASMGRDKEAIEAFASALTIPTVTLAQAAQPMNEIAWLYQKNDRAAEALPLARLAVQIAPDNPAYLDTLAHAALKQGAYEDALDAAKRALDIAPGKADFLYTLALGLEAAGQKQDALASMEKAASRDARYEAALADLRERVR